MLTSKHKKKRVISNDIRVSLLDNFKQSIEEIKVSVWCYFLYVIHWLIDKILQRSFISEENKDLLIRNQSS